jgi:hypothetical protein
MYGLHWWLGDGLGAFNIPGDDEETATAERTVSFKPTIQHWSTAKRMKQVVMNKRWLNNAENLSDPANKGVGSRSEWVELTSENHPGNEALRRKDYEGKVMYEHGIPIKILVRRKSLPAR